MTATRPADILRQLDPSDPDADLLARFVLARDQAAFAVLVRRHGPMVLAVCRRVTGHPQDAEDAFQAAFLTLARKAGAVGRPQLLGNWLYGVAVRVAARARRAAARRRRREVQVMTLPDPPAPVTDTAPDLGPVLHQELAALPAWYREAVVLCDLRGVPRADAAHALGVPEGTLSSRLANGRKRLAERLARRGVTLSAAAVPVALADARAAVPDQLLARTCDLVADWAAGGAVPGPLLRLIDGGFGMRQTFLVGAVGLALATAGVVAASRPAASPPMPPDPPPKAEAKPADPPKGEAKAADLAARPRLRRVADLPVSNATRAVWDEAGKRLAVQGHSAGIPNAGDGRLVVLVVAGGDDRGLDHTVVLPGRGELVGFEPDGGTVLTTRREYDLVSGVHRLQFWDVAPFRGGPMGGRRGQGGLPGGNLGAPSMPGGGLGADGGPARNVVSFAPTRQVDIDPDPSFDYAFAADRKTYRTVASATVDVEIDGFHERQRGRVEVRDLSLETGGVTRVPLKLDGTYRTLALAPNGSRLAATESNNSITVYDTDGGKKLWSKSPDLGVLEPDPARQTSVPADPKGPVRVVFSPDGRRLLAAAGVGVPAVLDAATGDPLPPLDGIGLLQGMALSVSLSVDGRLLAASGERVIKRELGKGPRMAVEYRLGGRFLTVWDTTTGKVVRTWQGGGVVAFHPTQPVLAVLEPNGDKTRLGVWDFAAEVTDKK